MAESDRPNRVQGGGPGPGSGAIADLYSEERAFPPPAGFAGQETIVEPSIYEEAGRDWQGFWAARAKELEWFRPWDRVCEWDLPYAKWFGGGTLNVSYNCIDRHVKSGLGERVAFHWEGEPGDTRTITYSELLEEVGRFANVLKSLGVKRGDRVAIYMPMIPELCTAMLACTRIGAVHSVVFGGFSSDALRDRIEDAKAEVLVTADGGWRKGTVVPLRPTPTERCRLQHPSGTWSW